MDNWLKSVWFIRIVSLVLAGLLWVTVNVDNNSDSLIFDDSSSDTEVLNNIPLEIRFDSDQYVVSGLPQEVSVTLDGPASAITPVVRQKNFTVFADLEGLGPGTHEVSLQHSGISNQLEVNLNPETIEVTIEEKVSQEYPVEVEFTNETELNKNLELGEAKVDPAQVTITGSSSVVERVSSVKAMIDVESVTESIEDQEAPVKVYDDQGNELNVLVDPNTVNVSVPVSKRSKKVQVQVKAEGEAPDGITVESLTTETKEVTLYGTEKALSAIDQLEVPVDLSNVTEDKVVEVDIPLPEGITQADPKLIEVQVDVSKAEEASTDNGPAGEQPDNGEDTSEEAASAPLTSDAQADNSNADEAEEKAS